MLDILIRNGFVVDGTGSKQFRSDVGIRDGKIVAIEPIITDTADSIIDADGLIICPGFIDTLSHSDDQYPSCRTADSKIMQGVTTEIVGNDGGSKAPLIGEARNFVEFSDLKDPPWESFSEYLDYLQNPGLSVNVASLVGLNPLRLSVVGSELRRVHPDELDEMKKLLGKCMEEGAWGMSTGLVYFPGAFSDTFELIELCKVVAKYGGIYASHQRGEKAQNLEGESETLAIAEYSKVRVHSSHQSTKLGMWGRSMEFVELRKEANSRGIVWTCDIDPGELTNVDDATGMIHLEFKPTKKFGYGMSKKEILALFGSKDGREWVKRLLYDDWPPGMGSLGPFKYRRFDLMTVIKSDNENYVGKTVEQIAKMRGDEDPLDTLFNIYLEQGEGFVFHSQTTNDDDIKTVLKHEHFASICTDAGVYKAREDGPFVGQPRAFNTFPMIFHKYVRGDPDPSHRWFSKPEKIVTLEEAIRKMTGIPAETFRIPARGLLREGFYADVVVFDQDVISSKASIYDTDVYPIGIPFVIVNGKFVKNRDRHTGLLPGEILRWNNSKS